MTQKVKAEIYGIEYEYVPVKVSMGQLLHMMKQLEWLNDPADMKRVAEKHGWLKEGKSGHRKTKKSFRSNKDRGQRTRGKSNKKN